MSVTTVLAPPRFAGLPLASWAFAFRIWVAVVVALYAAFWLQLEAASSAAVCVAILAAPTRGQALEKAGFRFLATVVGAAASIA
ncbi:MAG: FUSC family protein, partial [Alphaproteobacteria bacterium]|nr:FUSC family protein [Alphaproteobacteria bacterium]